MRTEKNKSDHLLNTSLRNQIRDLKNVIQKKDEDIEGLNSLVQVQKWTIREYRKLVVAFDIKVLRLEFDIRTNYLVLGFLLISVFWYILFQMIN